MKIKKQTITPSQALVALESSYEHQRGLRQSHVRKLAQEMTNGNWQLSCDAVLFINGKLANGQHRMAAVAESNTPQPFLVVESDDESMFRVLDCGLKRTVADYYVSKDKATTCAAVAGLVCGYDSNQFTAHGQNKMRQPTRSDVMNYLDKNYDNVLRAVDFVYPLYGNHPVVKPAIMASALLIGSRKNEAAARNFVTAVYTGKPPEGSAYLLRERVMKNFASKAKLSRYHLFALAMKALLFWLEGREVKVLKMVEGEEFPKI